jgi:branched-chain amino acid transport system ATP-binding protein
MILEVRDLSVRYGAVEALSGVSIAVQQGETVAVIGANGAGKSTLMTSIMGFNRRTSGQVLYRNVPITVRSPARIANMGLSLVPEGREVFPSLTVAENLRLGLKNQIRKTPVDVWQERLEGLYALFPRLEERSWQEAGTLSGGEQQMLVIARALAGEPTILLLDEPSLGLSPVLVREIFDVLSSLKANGTTILLVEQMATQALRLADRGYVLENGRVKLSGSGSALLDDPDVAIAYLGA